MASGSSWTWDNASTWEPVTRAPLLVCAHANSAVTTKSGVVMVAGRFPGLALMVSWDDAMSWEFYLIDTSGFAANGALVELEPDGKSSAAAPFAFRTSLKEAAAHAVVMYIYGGSYSPAGYRTQVFKVDRQARTATPISRDDEADATSTMSPRKSKRPLRRTVQIEF